MDSPAFRVNSISGFTAGITACLIFIFSDPPATLSNDLLQPMACQQLAHMPSESERDSKAETIYAELIKRGTDDTVTRVGLGRALWRQGKREQARELVEIALARDPNNTCALITLGEISQAEGRLEETKETATRCAKGKSVI